jgi:glycosyltransferase involved in cell wall biosynthesis
VRDAVVFIPAWNEEANLPAVLEEVRAELPDVDVAVVDDGSTDGTARVASEGGAHVVSLGQNRGLREAIAAGYKHALDSGYRFCGRLDADGQHPAAELRRLLELVRAGGCDVALGSRFVSAEGYPARRYQPSAARELGTGVLRRAMALRLGRPLADATSGMIAANDRALPLLAKPYVSDAPEVEALIRLVEAGLRVEEVAVDMRARSGGESKLQGRRALKFVLTIGATLFLGRRVLGRLRR